MRTCHTFVPAFTTALAVVFVLCLGTPSHATSSAETDSLLAAAAEWTHTGQFLRARDAFQQAIAALTPAKNRRESLAEALFNLGIVEEKRGDLAASALAFRRSLAVFETLPGDNIQSVGLALEGLASVLLRQENYHEARPLLDRALAIRSHLFGPNHPQMARLYALYALASQLAGDDPSQTEIWYYKALMAYRKIHGNVHPVVAQIIQNIGTFYTDIGSFQAWIMFQQATDVAKMLYGNGNPLQAQSLTNFGRLCWKEGNFPEAEAKLHEALLIFDHLGLRNNPVRGTSLYHLGRTLLAEQKYAAAESVLTEAARVYELNWWRAGEDADRSLSNLSPYSLLAVARLHSNDPEGALKAFASYQGRLASLASRLNGLSYALAIRRDSLVTELANCEDLVTRLETEHGQAHDHSYRLELSRGQSHLATAEEAWLKFQGQISHQVPASRVTAKVAEHLQAGEAAIGWLDVETRPDVFESWAFVLKPAGHLTWRKLPSSANGCSPLQQTQSTLEEIQSQSSAQTAIDMLRSTHLDPVADLLEKTQRLITIPSGALVGFPVELLLPLEMDNVYVLDLKDLHWPLTPPARSRNSVRVLAIADPVYDPAALDNPPEEATNRSMPEPIVLRDALTGDRLAISHLPRLTGTRREAQALAADFPQTLILMGGDASKANLDSLAKCQDLGEFDIIHLATHALIDAEIPGRSALVLSQIGLEPGTNGLLTVREIRRRWRLNAELVTLSACATGLGRRLDGEGFLGFSQALMATGTQNILLSLWPVDDRATAIFMTRFYRILAGETDDGTIQPFMTSPTYALRQARHWLRNYTTPAGTRPFAAPRYWAGFVLFSGS